MKLKPECIMTMCRETSIEAFNMQGRNVHPVASLHSRNLFLWASELLHCNSWAQSLCGIFYWFTFPRFFSLSTSQACFLTFQSIWFSLWLQQVHSRSACLNVLRRIFLLTCFFFSSKNLMRTSVSYHPPGQHVLSHLPVRTLYFSATWLCLSTLQNGHRQREDEIIDRRIYFILTDRMIWGSL